MRHLSMKHAPILHVFARLQFRLAILYKQHLEQWRALPLIMGLDTAPPTRQWLGTYNSMHLSALMAPPPPSAYNDGHRSSEGERGPSVPRTPEDTHRHGALPPL